MLNNDSRGLFIEEILMLCSDLGVVDRKEKRKRGKVGKESEVKETKVLPFLVVRESRMKMNKYLSSSFLGLGYQYP